MYNYGPITNTKTGETKPIQVEETPIKFKDYTVGLGFIFTGIWWLMYKAHKKGADDYDAAELKTLEDLDLII